MNRKSRLRKQLFFLVFLFSAFRVQAGEFGGFDVEVGVGGWDEDMPATGNAGGWSGGGMETVPDMNGTDGWDDNSETVPEAGNAGVGSGVWEEPDTWFSNIPWPEEDPASVPTQAPINTPMSIPTQASAPVPTQVPAQVPTQVPTSTPMSIPTQASAPVPTQVPTSTPMSIPTQASVPVPTPVPTFTSMPTPVPTFTSMTLGASFLERDHFSYYRPEERDTDRTLLPYLFRQEVQGDIPVRLRVKGSGSLYILSLRVNGEEQNWRWEGNCLLAEGKWIGKKINKIEVLALYEQDQKVSLCVDN